MEEFEKYNQFKTMVEKSDIIKYNDVGFFKEEVGFFDDNFSVSFFKEGFEFFRLTKESLEKADFNFGIIRILEDEMVEFQPFLNEIKQGDEISFYKLVKL